MSAFWREGSCAIGRRSHHLVGQFAPISLRGYGSRAGTHPASPQFPRYALTAILGFEPSKYEEAGAMRLQHRLFGFLLMTALFVPQTRAGPLHDAIAAGDLVRVRAEIADGADVNEEDLLAGLPLMAAAQMGNIEIAKLLLANGASVDAKDLTGTALHAAALAGRLGAAELLIERGADVNAADDRGTTPLQRAAGYGHVDLVELLIRHGGKINSEYRSRSALHAAAGEGQEATARLLLAHGADVRGVDEEGYTALHLAIIGGHLGLVQLLLDAGSDIRERSLEGTSLQLANSRGYEKIAELLRQHGAAQ
jgi:ankyrin repeat protein